VRVLSGALKDGRSHAHGVAEGCAHIVSQPPFLPRYYWHSQDGRSVGGFEGACSSGLAAAEAVMHSGSRQKTSRL